MFGQSLSLEVTGICICFSCFMVASYLACCRFDF